MHGLRMLRGFHRARWVMMGGGFDGPFGGEGFRGGPFGPGSFGGGLGGRGGHGGRRGKRFDGEELRLMVLGLLAGEAQHGYQLIRAFAAKSGDVYQPSPGVLYPLLTMLAEMDLVAEVEGKEGSARRRYALTEAGEAEVATQRERIDALFARLAALAEQAGRTEGAPVRRAMHNLRNAVVERLGREGVPQELAFDVAAIIDEATQKIERL